MRFVVRLARAIAAACLLTALLAGIPFALTSYVGWPLPDHLPDGSELLAVATTPLTDEAIVDVLACAVWAAWAVLAVSAAAELVTETTGRGLPRLPGTGWARILTGALIAAITTTTSAAADTIPAPPLHRISAPTHQDQHQDQHQDRWQPSTQHRHGPEESGGAPSANTPTAAHPPERLPAHQPAHQPAQLPADQSARPATHHVQPGETLWAIAAHHLGTHADPHDIIRFVHAIQAANPRITDPNHIEPGWALAIPTRHSATPPGRDRHHAPDHHRHPPQPSPHATPRTPPSEAPPSEAPPPRATPGHTRVSRTPSPTPAKTRQTPPAPHPAGHDGHDGQAPLGGFTRLPSGALVGAALAAAVAGALAVTRARRRAAYTPRHPARARGQHARTPSPVLDRLLALHHRVCRAATRTPSDTGHRPDAPAATTLDGDVGQRSDIDVALASMWAGATAPAHIEAGARNGRPVAIDLLDYGGLVVDGDGAPGCLRGLVAALAGRSGDGVNIVVNDPRGRAFSPGVRHVRRLTAWSHAVAEFEAAALGRARLLAEHGAPAVSGANGARSQDEHGPLDYRRYRQLYPADPLPLLCLVIVDPPAEAASRLAALVRSGPRHGVLVLVTGTVDALTLAGIPLLRVGSDGRVHDAAPPELAAQLRGTRMQCLTEADMLEILAVLDDAAHPGTVPSQAAAPDASREDTGPRTHAGSDTAHSVRSQTRAATGAHPGRHQRPAPTPPAQDASAQNTDAQNTDAQGVGRSGARPSGPATPSPAPTPPMASRLGHAAARTSTGTRTGEADAPALTDPPVGTQAGPSPEVSEARARPADRAPAERRPAQPVPEPAPTPPPEHEPEHEHEQGKRLWTIDDVQAANRAAHAVMRRPTAPSTKAGSRDAGTVDSGFADGGPVVSVRVLGPVQVMVAGEPIRTGLRSASRELLAFLSLHPDGASVEQIADAMWPGTEFTTARRRFWTALGSLRTVLRGPAGDPGLQIVAHHADRYAILDSECRCDVWQFEEALARAAAAADRGAEHVEEIAALTDAVDAYTGEFADGADYLWAEPDREDMHRRVLDAHVRLADLHAGLGRTQRAIMVLESAVRIDPLAEDVYTRLMRLHHQAGQPERARRVFGMLRERLADLDLSPSPASVAILQMANEQLRQDARRALPTDATDPTGLPPVT